MNFIKIVLILTTNSIFVGLFINYIFDLKYNKLLMFMSAISVGILPVIVLIPLRRRYDRAEIGYAKAEIIAAITLHIVGLISVGISIVIDYLL